MLSWCAWLVGYKARPATRNVVLDPVTACQRNRSCTHGFHSLQCLRQRVAQFGVLSLNMPCKFHSVCEHVHRSGPRLAVGGPPQHTVPEDVGQFPRMHAPDTLCESGAFTQAAYCFQNLCDRNAVQKLWGTSDLSSSVVQQAPNNHIEQTSRLAVVLVQFFTHAALKTLNKLEQRSDTHPHQYLSHSLLQVTLRHTAPQPCPALRLNSFTSEFAVVGEAWEGNDVPDVFNTSAELHQALKAQAKPCVGYRTVAPQVCVPPVVLGVESAVNHALSQHLHAVLTLTATNQLTNPETRSMGGTREGGGTHRHGGGGVSVFGCGPHQC